MLFFTLLLFCIVPSFSAEAQDRAPEPASSPGLITAAAGPTELAANFPQLNKVTVPVVVSISLNREEKGDYFLERDPEGGLFIKVEDVVALQLKFFRDRIVLLGEEKYIPLGAIREVTTSYDEKKLTVAILGKTTESKKTSIELYPLQLKMRDVYQPRELSAFLNYGLAYTYADPLGFQSFNVSNKFGASRGNVFFVSDSLYTKTERDDRFVRLQSSATYERRGDLQWLVVGDQFANSGPMGSIVNMGGIGFSKVFKLDPYFMTQPLFNLTGTAAFPSQADIYLDGMLIGKQPIAPGSFELKNIYSQTGTHLVDVVLKDPFGNEQKLSYPLYFNSQMLRQGLDEYSYSVGFVREQYGVESNEYGKSAFTAYHRYGVTNAFNIGARAEASDGVYNGGLIVAFLLPRFGAFTVTSALSDAEGAGGSARSLQHSYQLGSFSTNLLVRQYSRDYATIGSPPSPDMVKYETSAGLGFSAPPAGSFSVNYSRSSTYAKADTEIIGLSYSRVLSKSASLFVTASQTKTTETINGLFVGLNFTFDQRRRGSVSYNKSGDSDTETIQIQKDIPVGEGVGYRATLARNDRDDASSTTFNPFIQYNARYGAYSLDSSFRQGDGESAKTVTLTASGAVVYAGGFRGLTRTVSDSFGFVMVGNQPDIVVLNNGQVIGKTDASGTVIVPSMASYNQNQITVDTKNMPMDFSITGVSANVSPSLWSGACVAFEAVKAQAVTGRVFVRQADTKIPLEYIELSMKVNGKDVIFPTGKGGEFYLENTVPQDPSQKDQSGMSCRDIAERRRTGGAVIKPGVYHASAEYEGRTCRFDVIVPVTEDVIWDQGEIICTVR